MLKEAPPTGMDGLGGGGQARCVSLPSARPHICGCYRLKWGGEGEQDRDTHRSAGKVCFQR